MKYKVAAAFSIAFLWLGSIALVYIDTRNKWYQLGEERGGIKKAFEVIEFVCDNKTTSTPIDGKTSRFHLKDQSLSIKKVGKLAEIHCY